VTVNAEPRLQLWDFKQERNTWNVAPHMTISWR
jgi:hypothetical protein